MEKYIFDSRRSEVYEAGTENFLHAVPLVKEHKIEWHVLIDQYRDLKVGQGLLSHQTLNAAKSNIVRTMQRRGLELGVDYEIYVATVDNAGVRLPKGNWLQYIKRLSENEPFLL